MPKNLSLLVLLSCWSLLLGAQGKPLSWFLPKMEYDPAIPTPEQVFGFSIGKWHLTHDQLLHYVREVAAKSDRIRLEEIGRTHEDRPLMVCYISSPSNLSRLEEIRQEHLGLSTITGKKLKPVDLPVVLYQGFTIHGDEASGANAVPAYLYYLCAGRDPQLLEMLENSVILLDPCFNPDGMQRFSAWVNANKSNNLVSDPQNRELNQPWPGGRTNHYWFDLNRDWLPAQQPESKARLRVFQNWKPNVLTDHHEMGPNSTFFFQPGVPERNNPLTPARNRELTEKIGRYHAEALDAVGSLYFSKENFDDYFYGKGSTYPDLNGGIGILFEQAGMEGHLRATDNGVLPFSFAIRNQVLTALSTLKAANELRIELLEYQQEFYEKAQVEARQGVEKAWVFSSPGDPSRARAFVELLLRHRIEVFEVKTAIQANGLRFEPGASWQVPLEQAQYPLIRTIFESVDQFPDSIFYDISAWTLPLAFQLQYTLLDKNQWKQLGKEDRPIVAAARAAATKVGYSSYAYLLPWTDYYAPKALYLIQQKGLRTKVATEPFTDEGGRAFDRGTILIPVQNQALSPAALHEWLQLAADGSGVEIQAMKSGLMEPGIDLGSDRFRSLDMPRPALLTGSGVNSNEAGEIWHLFDQRYNLPLTQLELDNLSRFDLSGYNVLILVDGSYEGLSTGAVQKIKQWVQEGGTLVAVKNAAKWAAGQQLAAVSFYPTPEMDTTGGLKAYAGLEKEQGARALRGAIFSGKLDLTHPLGYGYTDGSLPLFRNSSLFFKPAKNPYATPLVYDSDQPLSGYMNDIHKNSLKGSAGIVVSGLGRGRVICMAQDPCFRAFWYGTNKLMANAVFFGGVIDGRAVERP